MAIHWVPAFEGRKLHKECKEILKELKASGKYYKVRMGHSIRIGGKKHSKVFMLMKKEVA